MADKNNCPRGFKWCPIKKQCIPMGTEVKDKLVLKYERYFFKEGKNMSNLKLAEDLLNLVLDENYEIFGKIKAAENKLHKLLDMCGMHHGEMDDESADDEIYSDAEVDASDSNDIEHVPNQDGMELYKSIRKQLGEWKNLNENDKSAYKKYFDSMLKKYGVTSPAQLDNAKKKQFFDAVDKGWKGKKETD